MLLIKVVILKNFVPYFHKDIKHRKTEGTVIEVEMMVFSFFPSSGNKNFISRASIKKNAVSFFSALVIYLQYMYKHIITCCYVIIIILWEPYRSGQARLAFFPNVVFIICTYISRISLIAVKSILNLYIIKYIN